MAKRPRRSTSKRKSQRKVTRPGTTENGLTAEAPARHSRVGGQHAAPRPQIGSPTASDDFAGEIPADARPTGKASSPEQPHIPPPIVGIGASAGGLDAYRRLLRHIPADAGLALVFVQHLDPVHESMLPELLGREAAIPVLHAQDGMPIEADHAYVIPPNTTMTVTDGHLRLVRRKTGPRVHLPIDAFLCSLVEAHGSAVVGVILSGAGSDGTRGIEAIKEAGGITMAQDGASAGYPSMPQSAVATGYVDFVLPPEGIAEQLVRLGRHILGHPGEDPAAGRFATGDEETLRNIFALIRHRTGVDFQQYRRGTVHRRLLRRMLLHQKDTRQDYLAHLRLNPAELDSLHNELLIGVTRFFRDTEVFASLHNEGFAHLMKGHAPDTPIRVWVAGCASGEEAYSIAMALLAFLGDAAAEVPIQIFGTDLSAALVAKARAGIYRENITADVSPERLRRFFVKEDKAYRISKAVRDLCVFSRQNILRDPPFSHLDLISCRNVFIYLQQSPQRQVLQTFHYALEPNGLLVLGNAESAGPASELFLPLSKRLKIYRRRAALARPVDVDFVAARLPPARHRGVRGTRPETLALEAPKGEVEGEADLLVLARFSPVGVVINERFEILQFRGDTTAFLAHAPGAPSLHLLKLARSELVIPLQAAVQRAGGEGQPVREASISVADGGGIRHVAIEVMPFQAPSTSARYFVVLFEEECGAPTTAASLDGTAPGAKRRSSRRRAEGRELRAHDELAATKRYLQAIVEEHDAAHEELRAANEEIQSSNEELQSTNEELETTKEEVQSTNEELLTVNEELRQRNQEQMALASDLSNVLAGTTIPIVIVGSDLRLRRFTPATDRVMRVIPSDVGRPLGDIKLRVSLPDLEQQIRSAVETLAVTEQEVRDEDGSWWSLTIRPYRTIDYRVDGAVLVFVDINASKRYGEQAAEAAEARRQLLAVSEDAREAAENANQAKSMFLASMSHDLRTPLNAIAGYTEIMATGVHGPVTDSQRVDLTRIERSGRHLLALINDILNFARLEAGRLQFRIADVGVSAVIAELEDSIGPQARDKLVRQRPGDCTATVRADPDRLRQILLNLLSNAAKFTGPSGQIGIRCAAGDDVVGIDVWDTGVGIAPGQLEGIFEPFVQVGRGLTSPPPEGVGLGLTISRDLARAMGGDLTVASVVGEGSTFTLTLPRGLA